MKKTNNIWKGLVALALGLALAASMAPTNAQAFSGDSGAGGGGGGGGGGSWGAITRWNYVSTWDELVNARYMVSNNGSADNYVRSSSRGQALLDLCKGPNLVRIYYLGAAGGIPIKPSSSTGTFPWSNPAGGDGIDQYASSLNGRGVYIICVVNASERITTSQPETRPRADSETITGAYGWTTAVTPEVVNSAGLDAIGAVNLWPQTNSTRTSFASLYDSMAAGGSGDYNARKQEITAAIAHDASQPHVQVELNAKNREGLAEGGVLSINEFTRSATIVLSQSWAETRTRQVTCDYVPGTNGTQLANPSNCSYDNWSDWAENTGSRSHTISKNTPTQANTAFWQILSVHCNPEELSRALTAYGREGDDYTIVSQTINDGQVTTVLNTRTVASRPTGADARIFGVTGLSNAALARTGEVGFYDKHCPIQCVADPRGTGASNSNGATANVATTSNAVGGGNGGATHGTAISNYFEMFRDNKAREVAVNIAYPSVSGTAFSYDGAAPIATTVTLWHDSAIAPNQRLTIPEANGSYPTSGSTPDTSAVGGQLSVNAVAGNSSVPLFTGNTAPTEQRNFSLADASHGVDAYSGPWATKMRGAYRTFNIAGTWASLANQPVVMNVKWEYQPTTLVTHPAVIGFDANRTATAQNTTTSQKIDVDCYGIFSNGVSAPAGYVAAQQTGSGTPNMIDRNVLNATNLQGTDSNLVIRFVRGVAE